MIRPYWRKTIRDNRNGVISGLAADIGQALNLLDEDIVSAAASCLLLWTYANLQDDLLDEENVPASHCLLADACLLAAFQIQNPDMRFLDPITESLAANANELNERKLTNDLYACGKSVFLISPLLFLASKGLSRKWLGNLEKSLRYALAAKQLADDVYDYKEDWERGKRTRAHSNLHALPRKDKLIEYFIDCALRITRLCKQARISINKIPALADRDVMCSFIGQVESNCLRFLSKQSPQELADHKGSRNRPMTCPEATA